MDFQHFIKSLLEKGGVNETDIKKILSPTNVKKLVVAFTHKSVNRIENYEYYEFLGDTVINQFIALYVLKRFPKIVNIGWLSKIKHFLQSKRILFQIAKNEGFEKHILLNPDNIYPKEKEKHDWYMTILEDSVEAFCGCIVEIFENEGYSRAVGIAVINNIFPPLFDKIDIPMDYEEISDGISRLQELYISKKMDPKVGSKNPRDVYFIQHQPDGNVVVKVYGWPNGFDAENPRKNKVLLSVVTSKIEKDAKKHAATIALKEMKNRYNIFLPYPDPFTPKNSVEQDVVIAASFLDFIETLLIWANINKNIRNKMLTPKHLKLFYIACTHVSFAAEDQEYFKFIGNPVVNCYLAYAVKNRFPQRLKHGWATRIQHTLRNKRMLSESLCDHSDIDKFIRYKKENILPHELLSSTWFGEIAEGTFDAICGCIIYIFIKLGYMDAVGIDVANNLINYFFSKIIVPLDYEKLFDPITRLKELYESKIIQPQMGKIGMRPADIYDIVEKEDDGKIVYTANVYGWPMGFDERNIMKNKVLLATKVGANKDEVRHIAAEEALRKLKLQYGKSLPSQYPYAQM